MYKILANTLFLGKDLLYLPECHSTNDVALQKYNNKEAGEGSIIITDRQTAGRGQRGNQWFSEPHQNLTFSLVLTPHFLSPREQFGLNMAMALGIRAGLSPFVPDVLVKWPNDIVHPMQGKLGGILIENTITHRRIELAIIGIGLNINQTVFAHHNACSMAAIKGATLDKERVFESVVTHIEKFYLLLKNEGAQQLKARYLSHLFRLGQLSLYDDGEKFQGTITGISEEGKLIIKKEKGSIAEYAFKEVRFV